MNLRDVLPAPKKVPTGNGDLEVRGLTLEQVSSLLEEHKDLIVPFFMNANPDFQGLVRKAPDLTAKIICMATRSEGQEDVAKEFPFAVQLEVVMEAWELSVPDLKKFLDKLSEVTGRLASQTVPAVTDQS